MSSLSHEISKLTCEVRGNRVHDQRITKELTMIVGYGRLLEIEPKLHYMISLQKHLIALIDLVNESGHTELHQRSGCILESLMRKHRPDAA
jgi:hypothetical protein